MRRRRRKVAIAAAVVVLAPAIASGEPAALGSPDLGALKDVGRGLVGLTDPDDVSADGEVSDNDQIGVDLLRDAGNPDALKQQEGGLDLPVGPLGIPGVILQAYQRAATTMAKLAPNCHMDWSLLASIGRIESNHARGGRVNANGDTVDSILGPVLNGGGFAAIADTDGGFFDGDNRWDRAVGIMQFIPSTWRQYASDGNGDRRSNPHNVFDATLAAAKYLCSGGLDMANPQQRATAVFRYNHSDSYVRTVLIWADAYAKGVTPLPSDSVPALQQAIGPSLPPASDGGSTSGGTPPPDTGTSTPPPVDGTTTTTTTTTSSSSTTTPPPPTCETTTPTTSPDPTTTPVPTDPTCPPTTTTDPPPTTTVPSNTGNDNSNPPPDPTTTTHAEQSSSQVQQSSSAVEVTTTPAPPADSSSSSAASEATSPAGP